MGKVGIHKDSGQTTSTKDDKPSSGGSGDGGGSGQSAADKLTQMSLAAAQDAKRRQAEADRRAKRQEITGLANIRNIIDLTSGQIAGVNQALNGELRDRLKQTIKNINLNERIARRSQLDSYEERVDNFEGAAEDNAKAGASESVSNLMNRSRERAGALANLAAQGAGESDTLRGAEMSLRNWEANQGEVNRSYYDTLRSINSALGDLTAGTKAQLIADAQAANAQKGAAYDQFYANMSEKWAQLGDLLGQRSEQYGNAWSMTSDPDSAVYDKGDARQDLRRQNRAERRSNRAYRRAAHFLGQTYKDPGLPDVVQDWEGAADFEGQNNFSLFQNAATTIAPKAPEGATLRKWV